MNILHSAYSSSTSSTPLSPCFYNPPSTIYAAHIHGYKSTQWNMVDLPEATFLLQKLSVAHQVETGTHESLHMLYKTAVIIY